MAVTTKWWGDVQVEIGQTMRWQIGPLRLWVQRLRGEWRIAQSRFDDPLHSVTEVGSIVSVDDIPNDADVQRDGVRGDSLSLRIAPMLADRPVVSRPDEAFRVPSGEDILLFVGSPLWISASTLAPRHTLLDAPVFRPSDTWFGPVSGEGELCYASKTCYRLRIEDVPVNRHRCVTAVSIRNHADDDLLLHRLKLPVHGLALYVCDDGRLWSQDVALERRDGGDHAQLTVGKTSPAMAGSPLLVSEARTSQQGNVMTRVFSTIFS